MKPYLKTRCGVPSPRLYTALSPIPRTGGAAVNTLASRRCTLLNPITIRVTLENTSDERPQIGLGIVAHETGNGWVPHTRL